MVTQNEVWQAAQRIRTRPAPRGGVRERVSVRSVRKELGGGSFDDIARPLALWKEKEAYHPVIETAELPEAFEECLVRMGLAVLEQARIEVTRQKLPDFAAASEGMAHTRDVLEEALAQVEHLEGEVARLRAELDGRRGSGASVPPPAPEAEPEPPFDEKAERFKGFVGLLMSKGQDPAKGDRYWAEVREAIDAALRKCGPLSVPEIYKALPVKLVSRGYAFGLPVTPGWLRYYLLETAKAGVGLSEADGCFALAADLPKVEDASPNEDGRAETMSGSRFWREFMLQAYEVLRDHGPLTAEGILERMDPELVAATEEYQAVDPALLRKKLQERIVKDRPFRRLGDGRFEAIPLEGPWDGKRKVPAQAKLG